MGLDIVVGIIPDLLGDADEADRKRQNSGNTNSGSSRQSTPFYAGPVCRRMRNPRSRRETLPGLYGSDGPPASITSAALPHIFGRGMACPHPVATVRLLKTPCYNDITGL